MGKMHQQVMGKLAPADLTQKNLRPVLRTGALVYRSAKASVRRELVRQSEGLFPPSEAGLF